MSGHEAADGDCQLSSFRITPIGTCRIHTPLNRAVGRYPIELDLRRNYGFVHTSDEALQLLKFMVGEKTFTPEVEPLVFRMADPVKLAGETWQPADLHIIEISSAKRLSFGDDVLQSNHLAHHFADFFANRERTRTYWNLVKLGNRRDLKLYLRELPAFRLLSSKDRELLVGLSLEQQVLLFQTPVKLAPSPRIAKVVSFVLPCHIYITLCPIE